MKLLSKSNTKIIKGEKKGYKTFILHLAPATLSGYNVCPMATKGCKTVCLNTAGMGRFTNVQKARIEKTKFLFQDRDAFIHMLKKEIKSAILSAKNKDLIPCFRLNGTSDLDWTSKNFGEIPQSFPDIQFYDYTKVKKRLDTKPPNLYLTYSASENDSDEVLTSIIKNGHNIAQVFFGKNPEVYLGYKVLNGDEDDLRFLDAQGCFVGLSAKGDAKKVDSYGFVKNV